MKELKDKYKKLIGKNIQNMRKEKGYKSSLLADSLGLKQSSYRNIETGMQLPKPEQLEIIARVLGCDWSKLLGKTEWVDELGISLNDMVDILVNPIAKKMNEMQENRRLNIQTALSNSVEAEISKYQSSAFYTQRDLNDLVNMMASIMELRVKQLYENNKGKNISFYDEV